jgi:peptidyl-tRNA hydrolase
VVATAFVAVAETLMNLSGRASGRPLVLRLELADLLVVCDDFNCLWVSFSLADGSSGGQKGLPADIAMPRHGDFGRLRLGIGPVPSVGTRPILYWAGSTPPNVTKPTGRYSRRKA